MPKGKKATINGERTVDRISKRLGRVRVALAKLRNEADAAGMFDREHKRACRRKIGQLEAEEKALSDELRGIRAAVDRSLA